MFKLFRTSMKKAIFRKKKSPPELYTKNSISLSLITIDIMWLLQLVGNVVTIYCFMEPVLSQEIAASPIYATSDFHFADKEGNIIKENSDPRLVLCCLLAEQAIAFKSGNMNHQIKNSII